eukprot:6807935-Pyramimonas_sp.AAC.1
MEAFRYVGTEVNLLLLCSLTAFAVRLLPLWLRLPAFASASKVWGQDMSSIIANGAPLEVYDIDFVTRYMAKKGPYSSKRQSMSLRLYPCKLILHCFERRSHVGFRASRSDIAVAVGVTPLGDGKIMRTESAYSSDPIWVDVSGGQANRKIVHAVRYAPQHLSL